MAEENKVTPEVKADVNQVQSKLVPELLNMWPVKILTSMIPGGAIIDDVIQTIGQYIDTVEKTVAIKGAGVAKKSIVVDATYELLLKKFPELDPFGFIVKWAVKEIIDFIVNMKNKFGWNWIPIVNG